MLDYTIPTDFYIMRWQAMRLLNISEKEMKLLCEEGRFKNLQKTPGGQQRYNMREILGLRGTIQPGGGQ